MYFLAAAIWLVGLAVVFGCLQRRTLQRLWREPMLRSPVLIIESDDWGPGPPADAEALQSLAQILGRHRDARGKSATITLGMLLAVPDTEKIRQADGRRYHAASISEPRFGSILAAIRRGADDGVFSPQLHGMEHYWPDAVMKASRDRESVRSWLMQDGVPRHEDLHAALQSRWIDGSALPSVELPGEEVAAAAVGEVEAFGRVFGVKPFVVVPPTFVWTETTEAAWSSAGVGVVVTPGTRYFARDGAGQLVGTGKRLYNGETGESGMVYVVRDDYFEPALGHRAERALAAIEAKTRVGSPTLLETHRFNFTGPPAQKEDALRETEVLLRSVVERFPCVRFMSTAELASAMGRADPDLVEGSRASRIRIWLARSARISRLRKLAWLTGAIVPAWLLYWALSSSGKTPAPRTGPA
jgi:hypothetical protein